MGQVVYLDGDKQLISRVGSEEIVVDTAVNQLSRENSGSILYVKGEGNDAKFYRLTETGSSLVSATETGQPLTSAQIEALNKCLDRLLELADDIQKNQNLAVTVPLTGQSLGTLLGLHKALKAGLVNPIRGYLQGPSPTVEGLLNWLKKRPRQQNLWVSSGSGSFPSRWYNATSTAL